MNRCERGHMEGYRWTHHLCFTCGCSAAIDIWTSIPDGWSNNVFWHVEHDGTCLGEWRANLEVNQAFEAGCVVGEIMKRLSNKEYYSSACEVLPRRAG